MITGLISVTYCENILLGLVADFGRAANIPVLIKPSSVYVGHVKVDLIPILS